MNISNPLAPTIVGSTVVTQNTFPSQQLNPAGTLQVVDLGNGQFAVSGTLLDGVPVILAVDASNPNSLVTSTLNVGSTANGMAVVGSELYVASGSGLQIYQSGGLFNLSVTAEVDVPNNGEAVVAN